MPVAAQPFTGTNQPGTAQDFPLAVGAGTTNLAITVAGTVTAWSHLLLKAGATPSDTDYDFLAAQNSAANAINLELPQLKTTNYILRVRTPAESLAHAFTVTVGTNVSNLRTLVAPATKPLVFTNAVSAISNATWHYFRVEVPANVTGWRVRVSSTNNGPDLYIRRDAPPDAVQYLKRSQTLTNDDLLFAGSELPPGAYYIGVFQPSGTAFYTLRAEVIAFTTLTWDPGTTHLGTQVYTNNTTNGGDYYFKITTENTSLGAWRTALNVSTGEANIYLAKGTPPSVAVNLFKSERTNSSDGFVVASSAFSAGEDWYYLVHAEQGARWNLVSGEPFVTDLGVVAADASSGSGNVLVGAEGMRFFQTTLPVNAVAWRLWLNGITNTIMVKKPGVPVAGSTDLSQPAQMLVVPSYLVGGQLYFVGVNGAPGATVNLDSRLQSFTDIPFVSSTNLTISGYGYATFRVQVPSDQLAWQMSVVVSNGNPNLAVRRNFIPNENNNDAYSEVASNVTDSITLVPPTLSDGTFYITVYGSNNYSCTLQSGNPEFTEINFTSVTVNTDTNRVGWRFFKVSDINQQLGALGWDLFVTNQAPGTRIALRRNAAPGIWNYRNPNPLVAGTYDFLSAADFLQRPGHQADVWYVGVFTTTNALGPFTLVTRELTADPVSFDGGSASRTSVPPGKWQFFRVDVPTNTLGWDVRLVNVTAGLPQLVVRRELLPVSLVNIGFSSLIAITNWPTGNQWVAGPDWTARNLSSDGAVNESGRVLTMGYNRPLETGTYYIGIISPANSTNEMSYTILSRGIGLGQAIAVENLDYNGGNVTNTSLYARDISVYRVNVPTNCQSWKVRLETVSGDALLAVARERIPNITAVVNSSATNAQTAGRKMLKAGNEHFLLLPPRPTDTLIAGDYYFLVASEGFVDTNATRIGTGSASYILHSLGPMPEVDLGLLDTNDLTFHGELEGGEAAAFHFHNYAFPTTLGFELSLEDRVGNPVMVSRGDVDLADPGAASTGGSGGSVAADPYGNEGGWANALQASGGIITVADPFLTETVMLKARSQAGLFPDATYTLRIRRLYAPPVTFDGGGTNVVNQTNSIVFFRVDVPAQALGWDIRVINVLTGSPQMAIAREILPLHFIPLGWNPGVDTNWPVGPNWIAAKDWTQRSSSPDGSVNEDSRILAMGMGRPLEPGVYYVGIRNPSFPAPISYSIASRGIGLGMTIPVVDLPFAGGVVTNTELRPREAAYYRVVMPPDAASWQLKLTQLTGESMMTVLSNTVPSVLSGRPGNRGKLAQKIGNEHLVFVPPSPLTTLHAITNYIAVVSEGQFATNATRIGIGTNSYVLESRGQLSTIDLGTVGPVDLVSSNSLQGGEVQAYQFTVPDGLSSLEVQLQNVTGIPVAVMRVGAAFPSPGAASTISGAGSVALDDYGNDGGYLITTANGNANTNLISFPNPTNGTYTVMVKARAASGVYSNASYTLVVRAISYTQVDFDGGSVVMSNHVANTWRYFRVDVPANALGWDVRLANVMAGQPKIVVRRDILPNSLSTAPWGSPGIATSWPTTNQWAAVSDWTRRTTAADGVTVEENRILAMGMGQPLEAGTYYIGVINSAGTNMSYTFRSRGIGESMTLPVTDLNFTGGSAVVSNLPPREAAYFRVQVPSNCPSWKIKVNCTVGEAMLCVLSNHVPNIDCGRLAGTLVGKFMQKAGDEHYLLLPLPGQSNIIAGNYYLAAVSEGINPASATRIGSGNCSFTVTSVGQVPINNLGTVGPVDLVYATDLEGGETHVYQFQIPPAVPAVEMRLENRVGNPVMVMLTNTLVPDPGGLSNPKDLYGNDGGANPTDINTNILTIANPTNGIYTLAVKARVLGLVYPDASYTLRVRQVAVPELNFTPEFNTNGLSNVATGLLQDNQRAYFKVVVPTNVHGQAVMGWSLDLAQSSGQAGLRVRKDALPSDFVTGMPYTANQAVIAPPVLTNGTWFVEVRGTNTTGFTLTSSSLVLQRPAWVMPGLGEASSTPGLVAPEFGDSGLDTNGVALPGDGGIDLQLGRYHYYAVTVPTNNGALLRVQLEGISGNPDVYIRTAVVPTSTHGTNGLLGTMFERYLTSGATEYGNFVPFSGKTETRLAPGTWFLAVRAVANANARYRLKLSTGNVQDLALFGGSAAGQVVAGSDWRYFRVQLPGEMPANWRVTFGQDAGDVVMHVRDSLPPGLGVSTNVADYKDWSTDLKNDGPYGSYDLPGTYTFTVPPVRPGNVYYLGFRAKTGSDATFSVSSTTSGPTNFLPPIIEFYGGSATNVIPTNSQVAYRILTPADALRWRHTSTHSNTVVVSIENGTYPTKSIADDFHSTTANSVYDRFLTVYPWLPNQTYYLVATNTSGVPQPFVFNMNGGNTNEDSEPDGMLDAWEVQYFGSLSATPAGDSDGDGVSNLSEFVEGTVPTDRNSLRPRLTVLATNGVVVVNPVSSNYLQGTIVTLTPSPNVGYDFVGWTGAATGNDNPLVLSMNTNKTIIPRFRVPGDDFDQRIALYGYSITHSGLANTGATKETGEPNHAGNAGGKSLWWTWTPDVSGPVIITTAGSNFRNALAAYTGSAVNALTMIATNLAGAGTNTSQVAFATIAGTTYQIAVDGFNGASGSVVLNLSMPSGILSLSDPLRAGDGSFHFTINGPVGQVVAVQANTNLATTNWTTLATLTNASGSLLFTDPGTTNFNRRFYRAISQ